jgi:two-component system, OmpR family, response regulator
MPGLDGHDVLRLLHEAGISVPTVVLTEPGAAGRPARGLTNAGDEYVSKPFSTEQVAARARAVLRRASGGMTGTDTSLTVGDLTLVEDSHDVWRGARSISLSPTEFGLLRYLMNRAGQVLSRAQILDHVWAYDFEGSTNVVETYVSYLRRKVDASGPRLIHTVRGFGYVIREPRTTAAPSDTAGSGSQPAR